MMGVVAAHTSILEVASIIAPRSQMGFSLGWHIILACLGVGLPGLILFMEWRGQHTGDVHYRLLARRLARALGVLFAVGAVSGTILSFEMGLLWSGLMEHYGSVIGLPFAIEGFAFFVEAIFLGIYFTAGTGSHRAPICCPGCQYSSRACCRRSSSCAPTRG